MNSWEPRTPKSWRKHRLKWCFVQCQNGIWGDEPDGENDIAVVRVADFDRQSLRVKIDAPTIRSVEPNKAATRHLSNNDLLIEKSGGGERQPVGFVVSYDHELKAVCSNFVARLKVASQQNPRFLTYLNAWLYSSGVNQRSIKQTTGIQNLDASSYLNETVCVPPLPTQNKIALYLDRETEEIDALIAEKKRMLKLLEEKRAALVTKAVTRGLNPNVPMKPSGLPWLGDVPKHWETGRMKRLFSIRDERSQDGNEELLTVSHITGVTPRSEKKVYMFKAEDMTGYKICEKGDLVVNTLWAFMGALGVSKYHGIVSPDYHVYSPNKEVDPAYLDMMCRSTPFKVEILRHSKGVWSSRLRLKPNEFFNLCFPMPPKQEQIRLEAEISSRSSGGFSIRSELMKSIELLNERRSALITAAVTGQIPLEKMAS